MIYGAAVKELNRAAGGVSLEAQAWPTSTHRSGFGATLSSGWSSSITSRTSLINLRHVDEFVVTMDADDPMVWRVVADDC